MRTAHFPFLYIDAFSGASGDMFLGALVDLGHPFRQLQADVAALGLEGIRLTRSRVTRAGISALRVHVRTAEEQPHRGRREIRRILKKAQLPAAVRRRAAEVFERLIEIEAGVHRIPAERVHLHEVGALDALADVIGTVSAVYRLGVEEIHASPVNLGTGTAMCAHGELPVPAPATAALLRHVPVYGAGTGEKTTPTGAALLVLLASHFGPLPGACFDAIGHGAGKRDDAHCPNFLRLLGGRLSPPTLADSGPPACVELTCQIDDMDPRLYGHLFERVLAAGALDVFTTPIQMKKQRPGTQVTVLSREDDGGRLGRILLDETTTLGYRSRLVERVERERHHVTVRTAHGRVRVKVSTDEQGAPLATPEYEDCLALARKTGAPLREVLAAAISAYQGDGRATTHRGRR